MSKKKIEIEKKYFLTNYKSIQLLKKLKNIGAKYIGDNIQRDIYFNVPGRDSLSTRECLRIRESKNKKEITYKPPTKDSDYDNDYFAKKEVNVVIDNVPAAKNLLLDIGSIELATVNKKQKCYKLDKFNIFIDNIKNVGLFLEIECIEYSTNTNQAIGRIDRLIKDLGLEGLRVEYRPYRDILIEKNKKSKGR